MLTALWLTLDFGDPGPIDGREWGKSRLLPSTFPFLGTGRTDRQTDYLVKSSHNAPWARPVRREGSRLE